MTTYGLASCMQRNLHGKGSIRGQALDQGSNHTLSPSDAFHCSLFMLILFMHLIPYDYEACWILAGLLIALLLFCVRVCVCLKNEAPPWMHGLIPLALWRSHLGPLGIFDYDMSKLQEGGDICLFFRGWISSPTSHFCTCLSCQCHAILLPRNFP